MPEPKSRFVWKGYDWTSTIGILGAVFLQAVIFWITRGDPIKVIIATWVMIFFAAALYFGWPQKVDQEKS